MRVSKGLRCREEVLSQEWGQCMGKRRLAKPRLLACSAERLEAELGGRVEAS